VLGGMFEDWLELCFSRCSRDGFILMLGSIGPQFWVAEERGFPLVAGEG
jgi:hypothetical protein